MTRPLGITVIGILVVLASIVVGLIGLAGIFVGLAFLLPGTPISGTGLIASGLLFLLLGTILGVSGVGLLRLRPWAWWLSALATAGSLTYVGYGVYQAWQASDESPSVQSLVTVAILGVIFVYLMTVHRFFRRPASPM
ncbi:MAG: hypothetical protein A3K68_02470 [Euryarchaeota archaeon RBG_16_68_13]|nr:MAG: hypothetical protein A3K68_02470 [Euryarchaeota archaeon RBG_16_68_13]